MARPFTITTYVGIKGETKPYRNYLKRLGGQWCTTIDSWLFDELMLPALTEFQRKVAAGEIVPEDEPAPPVVMSSDWRSNVNAQGTRAGKKWTPEEEDALLSAVQAGQQMEQIAQDHKRTEAAVTARLREIAHTLLTTGVSEYEVVCKTCLSAEELREIKMFGPKGDWRNRQRVRAVPAAAAAPAAAPAAAADTL